MTPPLPTRLFPGLVAACLLALASPAFAQEMDHGMMASTVMGGFENQEYDIRGSWQIETRDDGRYLVLSEDFRTRRAPDLKIFLSAEPAEAVTSDNATQGHFLAALETHRGGSQYRLPDDLDLSAFRSIVIHCERFSKLWGAGTLNLSADNPDSMNGM